jgi:hypothetical protein
MEVVHPRCSGLDVHKATVVACVMVSRDGEVSKTIRTFRTHTAELLALADWLRVQGVTHVAMESTGVYWKPCTLPESMGQKPSKNKGDSVKVKKLERWSADEQAVAAVRSAA